MWGRLDVIGRWRRTVVAGALSALVVATTGGCGGSTAATASPDASIPSSSVDASTDDAYRTDGAPPCAGPGCFAPAQPTPYCPADSGHYCTAENHCPDGSQTMLTGTVYDPAGRNPLADVVVFVPEDSDPAHLPPIATGASSCDPCTGSVRDSVTAAFTDSAGHFVLAGVPSGQNIPLVVQVGKWRRATVVPNVVDCATTQLPSSGSGQPRLPRNHTEGSMPQMALLTGGCDNVACFLQNVGVDASEFSAPGAGGRVDVYQGLGATGAGAALSNGVAGDCTTSACPLWSSKQALEAYDNVFLGCECDAHNETKPAPSLQAVHDWIDEGGQVFATHSQATWFSSGPADLQAIANWTSGPASGAPAPFTIDTSFAGGMEFAAWLATVGAATNGVVPLDPADVSTSVASVGSTAQAWIRDGSMTNVVDGGPTGNVKVLTASMPLPPADASPQGYCGRVYVTDIHPGGGQALQDVSVDGSSAPSPVPGACAVGPLSAGEKTLEFFLFDQAMCILGGAVPPPPPPDTTP